MERLRRVRLAHPFHFQCLLSVWNYSMSVAICSDCVRPFPLSALYWADRGGLAWLCADCLRAYELAVSV